MTDTHANTALVSRALEAFSSGDMNEVRKYIDSDIVWHVPGRGRFAGDLRGVDQVVEFFGETAGPPGTTSFSFDVRTMVASDDYVAMFVHYHHERASTAFDQDGVELFRIESGKIAEFWAFIRDSSAFDEFFS